MLSTHLHSPKQLKEFAKWEHVFVKQNVLSANVCANNQSYIYALQHLKSSVVYLMLRFTDIQFAKAI